MAHLSLRLALLLLFWLSTGDANFDRTLRTHTGYEPRLLNSEAGWGATKCIDFQEITTLFRPETFVPALVVTCELKSHQCITIRAVNSTHHYTYQGCVPQARVSKMCTEMAYEAAQKNGAEYFYCYDVTYDRLNVPANMPLAGRECCCNGDFCNRIENVRTFLSIIPHDEIISPFWRQVHRMYYNTVLIIGIVSICAIIIFWAQILWIICRPAQREDDNGWTAAPATRTQLMDDIADDDEEENDVVVVDSADAKAASAEAAEQDDASKKRKRDKKKGRRATKEADAGALYTDKTQDVTPEEEKTVKDDDDEKKTDKTAPAPKKTKEEVTAPVDLIEKKTQEDPKKDEKKEDDGGKQFTLPKAPKKLANGRVQYVSMFNENSDYDEDE